MIFIKTARSVISDHLKNSANIKKLKVGSEILKIKVLPLQSENEIITNFGEEKLSMSDFYDIAISLYEEKEIDVLDAYRKVVPRHNGEEVLTYEDRLKKHISSKTYDYIVLETHYYVSPHKAIVRKNIEDTISFIDSDFYNPIKDILFFLVNNYGYKYIDVAKLPSEDIYHIVLNEAIIRSDALVFALLIKTFFAELSSDDDCDELLCSLVETFLNNTTLYEPAKLKSELLKFFNNFEITLSIFDTGNVESSQNGKAKLEDDSIKSLSSFKDYVNKIKNEAPQN